MPFLVMSEKRKTHLATTFVRDKIAKCFCGAKVREKGIAVYSDQEVTCEACKKLIGKVVH